MDEQKFKQYCRDITIEQEIARLNAISKDLFGALTTKQMEENIRIANKEN